MIKKHKSQMVKKAGQSLCRFKISAFGLNHKNKIIYKSTNKPRFKKKRGGIHAEMEVMLKAGPSLKTIIICRVNKGGNLLPIDPCSMCKEKADELGIKIISLR